MNKKYVEYVEAVTAIANSNIKKGYHNITIKEWETRYILEAKEEFDNANSGRILQSKRNNS